MENINKINIDMIKLQSDISHIKQSIKENKAEHKEMIYTLKCWRKEAEEKFVDRNEFMPIKNLVYGLIGAVMVSLIGGVVSLMIG